MFMSLHWFLDELGGGFPSSFPALSTLFAFHAESDRVRAISMCQADPHAPKPPPMCKEGKEGGAKAKDAATKKKEMGKKN